jgi:DNA-binding beta-propeller fold protein YncE
MKVRAIRTAAVLLFAGALLGQVGCGGGGANQVEDTVSPTTSIVVAATTQTFVSTVTGSTNLNSTWSCQYVYTPLPTNSTPNPRQQGPFNCTSGQTVNGGSIGTWTTDQTSVNNTLSYTSPPLTSFPNPIPTITFTAAAAANTGKKGTAVVSLDTGIRIAVSPTTATVPVGITPAQQVQFTATLATGAPLGLNWKVMQPVASSSTASNSQICNAFPALTSGGSCGAATPNGATCSPSCGSIDASTGIFTAPSTMPTKTYPIDSGTLDSTNAPVVTVLVWKSGDIYHTAAATITLVNASTNPITFSGISPSTIAAGGILQDIWLDANNILNTTPISFTPPGTSQTPQTIDPSNIFTIPITSAYCTPSATGVTPVVTCNASILTRVRLTAAQLAKAGTAQITVSNIPSATTPGQATSISYPLNLVYADPAIVSAVPDSYPQGTAAQFSTDGGYYGSGSSPLVNLLFDGNLNLATGFSPRSFTGPLQGSQLPSPGLYPVSIVSNAPASSPPPFAPPPYPSVSTNVAVQPTFAALNTQYFAPATTTTPQTQILFPPHIPLPAMGAVTNLAPSSMAINSTKGYALITEQGSNSVQLVNFTGTSSLGRSAPVAVGSPVAVGHQPTGVSIDNQIDLTAAGYPGDDLAVVVNSADSTLTLLAVSSTSVSVIGSPIGLTGLIQEPPGTTAPLPFSVGIDPTTHLAIVAFSNATLGFIVYVNPNPIPSGVRPPTCFNTSQKLPCAIASVSLNTGATPEVVMQPNVPLAYVTPGGTGVTSVVNLLLTNNSVAIAPSPNGATCTAGIATIITSNENNLNQASPGAVLIAGVTPTVFNGTYNVLSASTYTLTYSLNCPTTISSGGGGTVTFGNPYYTFSTTATAAGAGINPITRNFAFADPNASTGTPQIGFISNFDQSVTSLYLTLGSCQTCTPSPSGAPEVGVRSVNWDPYTNFLVAYDPQTSFNLISLIDPGGPTATGTRSASRIIQAIATNQLGQGSFTPSGSSSPVTVYGPMAYDPKTNLVLVANAGSNTLTYLDIDPTSTFKPISIQGLQVTSGGVPSAQPPLASTPGAPSPLPKAVCDPTNPENPYASCFPQSVTVGQGATIRILGQGFLSGGAPTVRLDGSSTGITVVSASDSEVDISVAASRFNHPHDFALDVLSGSLDSNIQEVYAVSVIDLSNTCSSADMPEGVAYDSVRNVAVVTNYGCNSVSIINMDSTNAHNYGVPYGAIMSTVAVGLNPLGVDVIPRLGYAVTANNGDSSAAIINISNPLAPNLLTFTSSACTTSSGTTNSTNICVGITPSGVAIDQDRALALVANTGGNSISAIDLTVLLPGAQCAVNGTTCAPPMQLVATSGPPVAIAVDPNRAEAVVTNTQNNGTSAAAGGLDVVSLSSVPPAKSSTASISSLTANPTGIVYDPAVTQACSSPTVSCGVTLAPALFYVSSTQQNAVYTFNPDTSSTTQISVGVNPYSLGYNYQTGTLISINSTSNTTSVIDTVNSASSVFSTRNTLGFGSQSQFAVAVDNLTNTAVIADQNNNRVLILKMPQ